MFGFLKPKKKELQYKPFDAQNVTSVKDLYLSYGLKLYEWKKNDSKDEKRYLLSLYKNGKEAAVLPVCYGPYFEYCMVKDIYLSYKGIIGLTIKESALKNFVKKHPESIDEPYTELFDDQIRDVLRSHTLEEFEDKSDYTLIADYSVKRNGYHYFSTLQKSGDVVMSSYSYEANKKQLIEPVRIADLYYTSYEDFVSDFIKENMTDFTKEAFFMPKPVHLHCKEPVGTVRVAARDVYEAEVLYYNKHPEEREKIIQKDPFMVRGLPKVFGRDGYYVLSPYQVLNYPLSHEMYCKINGDEYRVILEDIPWDRDEKIILEPQNEVELPK